MTDNDHIIDIDMNKALQVFYLGGEQKWIRFGWDEFDAQEKFL